LLYAAPDAGHLRTAVLAGGLLRLGRAQRPHHGPGTEYHAECDDGGAERNSDGDDRKRAGPPDGLGGAVRDRRSGVERLAVSVLELGTAACKDRAERNDAPQQAANDAEPPR